MQPAETPEIARITGEVLKVYLEHQTVDPALLPQLARELRLAIAGEPASVAATVAGVPTPRIPLADTVQPDYLVCLEDGQRYRSLKRHLKTKYDLTPAQYRAKWGLPDDYPMVAPSLSARRSEQVRMGGFGRALEGAAPPEGGSSDNR